MFPKITGDEPNANKPDYWRSLNNNMEGIFRTDKGLYPSPIPNVINQNAHVNDEIPPTVPIN